MAIKNYGKSSVCSLPCPSPMGLDLCSTSKSCTDEIKAPPPLELTKYTMYLTNMSFLAVVTLSPVHYPDNLDSERILVFNSAYDTIEVGRSSKTEGKQLEPDVNNAWFSSRVISRTHAKIWTNPDKKVASRYSSCERGTRLTV
jgi:hypothetical protein